MYRLVALDLDGTLVGHDGLVCEEHRLALKRVQQMGLEVMLVTARTWADTQPLVHELRITSPTICYTGAATYDPSGRPLQCQLLGLQSLRRITAWADAEGWPLRIFHPCGTEVQSHPTTEYVNKIGAWFVEPHQYVQQMSEYVQMHEEAVQVVLLGSRSVEAACARLGELPGVTATAYDRMTFQSRLHLLEPGVSKGAALAAYCRQREIPRPSVIAMGDTAADASMISWAGVGVAMGWAPEPVRSAADLVTSPNDAAPVATALKQLVGDVR